MGNYLHVLEIYVKIYSNVIHRAQSGTGKTATYSISALQSVDTKVSILITVYLHFITNCFRFIDC